ncbi:MULTISPECIES: hypothetical protein [unclassified Bradyrhizobium]|uniref:hypothetical protein n=1 Tax=unclassified Bradyrhizobium TaxID=2631580 RepID=UPI0028EF5253|nr:MULTISPECIES: hypothetical protein [unclassified Bradyrhizobium]
MYDAVANEYCYLRTTVLKNKLDIRDAEHLNAFEAEVSDARADEEIPAGDLDFEHLNRPRTLPKRTVTLIQNQMLVGLQSPDIRGRKYALPDSLAAITGRGKRTELMPVKLCTLDEARGSSA